MYLVVPGPPAPPPPSFWCKALNLGCPAPVTPNPDNLASLYGGLQTELQTPGDAAGSTNSSTVQGLAGYRGIGCGGGACTCGGKCKEKHGMGQIFASGTDISGWGWEEWTVIGIGLWGVAAIAGNIFSVSSGAASRVRKFRRRRKKRAELQQELAET